jgi:putative transposase
MPNYRLRREDITQATFHVFNRGVERRQIFMDGYDYRRFLLQLSRAQASEPEVTVIAYALMPNHFHLLLNQSRAGAITRFMRRLSSGYSLYFNHRYHRVGSLMQGKYNAVRVVGPSHLIDVSMYIHLNPERAGLGWRHQQYTSLANYTSGPRRDDWLDPAPVLGLFDDPGDYLRLMSMREVGLPPKTLR